MFLNYYLAVCEMEAIGLATGGAIPDSSFKASTYYNNRYKASYGRLNENDRYWAPRTTDEPTDFLQIDLPDNYVICSVATQGANGINEWTTNYKIQLSLDGITFFTYQENNIDKVGGTVISPFSIKWLSLSTSHPDQVALTITSSFINATCLFLLSKIHEIFKNITQLGILQTVYYRGIAIFS